MNGHDAVANPRTVGQPHDVIDPALAPTACEAVDDVEDAHGISVLHLTMDERESLLAHQRDILRPQDEGRTQVRPRDP